MFLWKFPPNWASSRKYEQPLKYKITNLFDIIIKSKLAMVKNCCVTNCQGSHTKDKQENVF